MHQSEVELTVIYDYALMAIFIVDKERCVKKINNFALKFANRQEQDVIGLREGEALRCLYSIEHPKEN